MSFRNIKCEIAFTLAEVLIVLAIIGVVAVIVFPIFMQDLSERINSNRDANIAQKITKSMEVMAVNGDYENFNTTEDFVNHLKKYLKIAKVCDSNHLTDCWSAKIVTGADGNKYEVKNTKTGAQLHTNTTTNVVGLVLADGASLLMTYDPTVMAPSSESSFVPYKKKLPIGNNKFEEFAYSSNVTRAIDYVVDLNGSGGPNAEPDNSGKYYDIRSFKRARFSNSAIVCDAIGGFKVNGVCIYVLEKGTYEGVPCMEASHSPYCGSYRGTMVDYLAGARKACEDLGLTWYSGNKLIELYKTYDSRLPSGIFFGVIETYGSRAYAYKLDSANGTANFYDVVSRSDSYPAICGEN